MFYDQMLRAREICSKTLSSNVRWMEQTITLERLSQLYVPQRVKVVSNSHERNADDSNKEVSSLLTRDGSNLIFILADAGRGKTWLTWSFAQDAARKYIEEVSKSAMLRAHLPPIPFLIPFSQYKRLTSFDGIILERLNSFGTLDIRAEGFKHLLTKGRIVLILDGFDEMLELAPAHARENLQEIRRHLQGYSKLILTSRRSVFPTPKEIYDFIGAGITQSTKLELAICYLEGFSTEQLKGFHRARGADENEITKILNLPFDKKLHESPQVAEYFLDIVRTGLPLKQKNVFPTVLSLIYSRESGKWAKEPSQEMPAQLQEHFLTEISLLMWPEGATSPELVQLLADELGHRSLSKHHLLQPTLDGTNSI
jgi:NACHT domain